MGRPKLLEYMVDITCADQSVFLSKLSAAGLCVRDISLIDPFVIRLNIDGKEYLVLENMCKSLGYELKIYRSTGISVFFRQVKKRGIFICGLLAMLLLTVFIPTRVFFISVEGNDRLEDARIIDAAQQSGLSWGVSRASIRSEKLKNKLLETIPELRWVGINTYGCRAVISVKERAIKDIEVITPGAQGIYAIHDGIISSITATKGAPLCKTGQAVKAGQVLISGYTDRGLVTRAEQAEGEVYAITKRQICGFFPISADARCEIVHQKSYWSVRLGKKHIKLYFGSGNYDARCGKIYKTIDLVLPGGFRLPVSFVKESVLTYSYDRCQDEVSKDSLHKLAVSYIKSNMLSGEILKSNFTVMPGDSLYTYNGGYICNEAIGILRREEIN